MFPPASVTVAVPIVTTRRLIGGRADAATPVTLPPRSVSRTVIDAVAVQVAPSAPAQPTSQLTTVPLTLALPMSRVPTVGSDDPALTGVADITVSVLTAGVRDFDVAVTVNGLALAVVNEQPVNVATPSLRCVGAVAHEKPPPLGT